MMIWKPGFLVLVLQEQFLMLIHISQLRMWWEWWKTAPEYLQMLTRTEKCDIYFGVLLAGLVMGKLPSDKFFQHTSEMSFVKWMRNVMASENPKRAIDSKLVGNGCEEQMLLVLKIACFCTLEDPNERPNSKDVRRMLLQIQH
ncbi:hypothetical protein CUMW_084400 [Citrus unshiu]|nr:hypothetical protein CUMW_084400 [Citrus unshiu]